MNGSMGVSEIVFTIKCTSQQKTESYSRAFNYLSLWGRSTIFTVFFIFQLYASENAGDFPCFAAAGAQLEISLKGWSLQQNAGDLAIMA